MFARKTTALIAGLLTLGLGAAGAAGVTSVSALRQASNPTAPERHVVLAAPGDGASSANMFTPKYLDVYAGDTVTWRIANPADPHTVSFGPKAMLEQLAKNVMVPAPQKAGPPLLEINPQAATRTVGATYDGAGFANSGILAARGQSWSLTFTRPGTYHYICLVHGDSMGGEVIVHPRPARGHLYTVQAGDSDAAGQDRANVTESTAFFPRALTIHEGDTVEWVGGFHTVTFGPDALRHRLEDSVLVQVKGTGGTPQLVMNPQIAYPAGGAVYDGHGFSNSGLLFMRAQGNQPPVYRLTFSRAGTYEYDCLLHKGMDGTITVLPRSL